MKLLSTIKNVEVSRQYKRQDGTYGNVYGVTIESGDDVIFAETFLSSESQAKRGIVPGAIGTATIALNIREWNDIKGNKHYSQDARLSDFALANRNINTEALSNTEAEHAANAAEQLATEQQEAVEAKVDENGNPLPF